MELVDIKFSDLRYHVHNGIINKTKKLVLKGVSGEFRGGELTAIVGQSGSGKTSLINCLSSFITRNVTGSIHVESKVKNIKVKYIMQEDTNYQNLTVHETMMFSIKFKTGYMDEQRQRERIISILERLGIAQNMNFFVKSLSTGEQKRLSIALELIDDPKIIFLDECTTGLDSSSSTQCIKLLKNLATEGRTVICTIHQPSASILKMFDHMYAMSDGCCIYEGSNENLLPFLQQLELVCPCNNNPVDYLLEIANNADITFLVRKIRNGKNEEFRKNFNNNFELIDGDKQLAVIATENFSQTPSFSYRLWQLIIRNWLLICRDKSNVIMRLSIHLMVGIMIGIIYSKIGNDANEILNEFKFIFILNGFIAYSGFYSLMIRFPMEVPFIIKREHFNQNYSTLAYQMSILIADVPITISCTCIYVTLAYFLTNQPMELFRFATVLSFVICVSFIAQAYGTFIGSMFCNLQTCLIVAALLMASHIVFSGFIVLEKDAHWMYWWIFETVYMKHAFYGVASLILGYDREKLECHQVYCHFQNPKKFLEMIGVNDDLMKPVVAFSLSFFILHFLTYFRLRYRLKN